MKPSRDSLLVKVMDSWLACHELEPNKTEEPSCRKAMHVKSIKSSNVLPFVWCGSYERGLQFRYRPRHLTMVQNYENTGQLPLSVKEDIDVSSELDSWERLHFLDETSRTLLLSVLDESRSFFRVHTGYFSNIPKCIKAEFIASWACSQSSVVSSSKR
ncbi:uncharacterized protein TNCV_614301 [Trichonephila clavipes]|nr:uncharacterized protein TNCV_614301 [Trichonephila clavipes]